MHVTSNNVKRDKNLKNSKMGYMGEFGRREKVK